MIKYLWLATRNTAVWRYVIILINVFEIPTLNIHSFFYYTDTILAVFWPPLGFCGVLAETPPLDPTTASRPTLWTPPPFFFLFFPHARTARRCRHTLLTLEWRWNWISPGWLKHVGLCEPVSGVQVHHLSQSAGCVMYPGKWGCCGSADGAAPRWWKCIRWVFCFFGGFFGQ